MEGGSEDPSTRKILEGETTFRVGLHAKFRSVCLTDEKELRSKDNPLNDQPPFLFCLFLALENLPREGGLPGARIFLVLGLIFLSLSYEDPSTKENYNFLQVN